jgi:hypothetical protein
MPGPINREVDLAHDNDGDSDFGLRHEHRRACSNLAVTFNGQIDQTDHTRQIDKKLPGIRREPGRAKTSAGWPHPRTLIDHAVQLVKSARDSGPQTLTSAEKFPE